MDAEDLDYLPEVPEKVPHFPNKKEVNYLVRDMGLTKSNVELFISRMKQWNLVKEEVQVTSQRSQHEPFSGFYTLRDGLCFCHDVPGLFDVIGVPFVPKAHRQLYHKFEGCPPPQWKQVPDAAPSPFSLPEGRLLQCESPPGNSAIQPVQLGNHWRLQDGGFPAWSPGRLYQIPMFPLPLGQQSHL
ncbi:hypothetical protein Pcinc_013308 [Petrolisthes cinctipes]|nr:hypothetical protein Pcinc_013308 [Petrolisthes cinctipes]